MTTRWFPMPGLCRSGRAAPPAPRSATPGLDREQRRWLDASFELTQALFGWTDEPPLDAVLRFALRAAAADVATFTAPLTERTGAGGGRRRRPTGPAR